MSEIVERYAAMREDLEAVLTHGIEISHALAERGDGDERAMHAKLIFSKMLGHGISMHRLSPSGIVPEQPGATEIWDVSSVYCICRALVESFDALAYVAIEDVSAEERAFRVLLWHLHAEDRRLQSLLLIGSTSPGVAKTRASVASLRAQLEKTPFLSSDPALQAEVLGKKIPPFHLRAPERNRRNEVNHAYYTASYILLSSHTHTSNGGRAVGRVSCG